MIKYTPQGLVRPHSFFSKHLFYYMVNAILYNLVVDIKTLLIVYITIMHAGLKIKSVSAILYYNIVGMYKTLKFLGHNS